MQRDPGDATRDVLRRYAPMVYGPTALYSIGQGALLPLIPALTRRLSPELPEAALISTAALIAAILVVGQLCGNIPAGWLVSRFGERITMIVASLVSLVGAAGVLFAVHVVMFGVAMFVLGLCAASFAVARHTFMTTRVDYAHRARALSLVGGSFRLGTFTGPFITAGILAVFHDEIASVWFFAGCLLAVALLVAFGPDPERKVAEAEKRMNAASEGALAPDTGEPVTGTTPTVAPRIGVFGTIWRYRRLLSRLGLAAASLAAVRAARPAMIPLWGTSIGLDSQTLAIVVGIAGAVEFSLFYASGQIMDRFGRLWASVPSMVLMGAGFGALAFTHDLSEAPLWLGAFAVVIAVGNGLSSGILLTLGADVAPSEDPAPFLGAWRTLTDGGGATMPLVISGITAVLSLPFAAGFVGLVGLGGAVLFIRFVPRYAPGR